MSDYVFSLPVKHHKPPKPKPAPSETVGNWPVSAVADQFTDLRLAIIFAEMFKDKLRYWAETGKWLFFDGVRWITDMPGGAFPFVRELIEALYRRAAECSDYAQKAEMRKAILKLEAHQRQETILSAAKTRPELIITADKLDSHPMLLTVNNGTVDLKTAMMQPHQAEHFITRMTAIEYSPAAQSPLFLKFLNRIFDGNQETIKYLQRFAGYCLTGLAGEQVLLFLYGLGCNGKSVLANILGALLGDFGATATSDLLMARDNRTASNDIAALRGARLVKVSEFDDGEKLAESQIKTLTGGDPVTCRYLYQEYFTYTPAFKILLIGNHRPQVRGTDHGIWRRLHLLPFNITIPEDERDPHLEQKLRGELPGILSWAVQGCLEWQQKGLAAPDEIRVATAEYRQAENVLQQWLDECCNRGEYFSATANALLTSFIEFSKWRSLTTNRFGRMLTDAGFTKGKSSVSKWEGLTLKQQNSQEGEPF